MRRAVDLNTSEGRAELKRLAELEEELEQYDRAFDRLWAQGLQRKESTSSYLSGGEDGGSTIEGRAA